MHDTEGLRQYNEQILYEQSKSNLESDYLIVWHSLYMSTIGLRVSCI